MPSTHGHEVMHMMVASGQSFTRETLLATIASKFGEDARFHTCSADDMTAGALIDFLEAKGKFSLAGDKMGMDPESICNHG